MQERSLSQLPHEQKLAHRLEKALAYAGDTHTISDIGEGIIRGRFQYFGDDDAGVITELLVYPQRRSLHVFLVCGELDAVMAFQPQLIKFARDNGCDTMTCTGRKGWQKVLPQHGWHEVATTFAMDVSGKLQ
jgi:hypothetical protein